MRSFLFSLNRTQKDPEISSFIATSFLLRPLRGQMPFFQCFPLRVWEHSTAHAVRYRAMRAVTSWILPRTKTLSSYLKYSSFFMHSIPNVFRSEHIPNTSVLSYSLIGQLSECPKTMGESFAAANCNHVETPEEEDLPIRRSLCSQFYTLLKHDTCGFSWTSNIKFSPGTERVFSSLVSLLNSIFPIPTNGKVATWGVSTNPFLLIPLPKCLLKQIIMWA